MATDCQLGQIDRKLLYDTPEEYPDYGRYLMSHDPIVVEFNMLREPMNSLDFRNWIASTFDTSYLNVIYHIDLESGSNDIWGTSFYEYKGFLYPYEDPIELKILYQNDTLCQNLADEIKNTILSGFSNEIARIQMESFDDLEDAKLIGDYDMILHKVDLDNINSIYTALYPLMYLDDQGLQPYTVINDWLETAKRTITPSFFGEVEYIIQLFLLQEVPLLNLGWEPLAFISTPNLSHFIVPKGFCPTGDASRIDFRWIAES